MEYGYFFFSHFQKGWCDFSDLSSLVSFLLLLILQLFAPQIQKENIKIKIIPFSQSWGVVKSGVMRRDA